MAMSESAPPPSDQAPPPPEPVPPAPSLPEGLPEPSFDPGPPNDTFMLLEERARRDLEQKQHRDR